MLLKVGRYHGAANLITAVASIAVTAGLFAKVNRDAYAGYTTFITSSVLGTKGRHAVLLTLPKGMLESVTMRLARAQQEYDLTDIYIFELPRSYQVICLKTVQRNRYQKILDSVRSPSAGQLRRYERVSLRMGPLIDQNMRELERQVMLTVLDRKWREHLYEMDYLREGIGLRAMAQRDPLVEYQREGFQLFQAMTEAIKEESVGFLFNLEVTVTTEGDEDADEVEVEIEIEGEDDFSDEVDVPVTPPSQRKKGGRKAPDVPAASGAGSALGVAASGGRLVAKGLDDGPRRQVPLQYSAPSVDGDAPSIEDGEVTPVTSGTPPVTAAHKDGQTFPGTPRNAECPCGSGKKYKVCHGRNE